MEIFFFFFFLIFNKRVITREKNSKVILLKFESNVNTQLKFLLSY
jgi:hypothetical protein